MFFILFLAYLSIVNAFDAFFDFLFHISLKYYSSKHFFKQIQVNYLGDGREF